MLVGLKLAQKAARAVWGYTYEQIAEDPDGEIHRLSLCSDRIANAYTYDWLIELTSTLHRSSLVGIR